MPYAPSPNNPYTQDQTLSFYQTILAGAPKAKVVAIAPSRHFAMLDQPEKFYALLDAFLTTP
jgi:pimeloyl-ACP methyl ester carboxylesterase